MSPPQEQSTGPAWQRALQQPQAQSDPERGLLPARMELVSILSARTQLERSTWQQPCEGYLLRGVFLPCQRLGCSRFNTLVILSSRSRWCRVLLSATAAVGGRTRRLPGLTGSSLLRSCLCSMGAQQGSPCACPGKAAPRK